MTHVAAREADTLRNAHEPPSPPLILGGSSPKIWLHADPHAIATRSAHLTRKSYHHGQVTVIVKLADTALGASTMR